MSYVGWQSAEISPVLGVRAPGGMLVGAAFSVVDADSAGLKESFQRSVQTDGFKYGA